MNLSPGDNSTLSNIFLIIGFNDLYVKLFILIDSSLYNESLLNDCVPELSNSVVSILRSGEGNEPI
jgi:hypothetical protein